MDSLIVFVAKYVLYIMVVAFALIWLLAENRRGKVTLGAAAVFGLIIVLIFMVVAGALHDDPRPFVQDPSLTPLFAHAPDNGFPSDHSCAAGLMAMLITLRRHWWPAVGMWIAAFGVAASRVAAHVHHVQDVVAGLAFGALAAWLGILLAGLLVRRLSAIKDPRIERILDTSGSSS